MQYIAFLRGINVGKSNRISMLDLQYLFTSIGFDAIRIYGQSGNIIFTSKNDEKFILTAIEKSIFNEFKLDIKCLIRKEYTLLNIIKNNPFFDEQLDSLYITFLSVPPLESISFVSNKPIKDKYKVIGSEVYLLCNQPYHTTIYSNSFIEKQLHCIATTRSWRVIQKISEMCRE